MKCTLLAALTLFALLDPCRVIAQTPSARTPASPKVFQSVTPLADIAPADKAKVAGWEKTLSSRRPSGSSVAAAERQVADYVAKQAALGAIATAPTRANCWAFLAGVVADKDEDPKLRTAALDSLIEITSNFALTAANVDVLFAGTFAVLDRKGDETALAMRLQLISLVQATVTQPQLSPPKKKSADERITALLVRENVIAAGIIRDSNAKLQKIRPSSTDAEQREAFNAIKPLDTLAMNRNLSDENRASLLKTLTEGLPQRYNQSYHFDRIISALEKLGDPKAIPALEAFLAAHPTAKIDPNVTAFVIGLAKHAIKTLKNAK